MSSVLISLSRRSDGPRGTRARPQPALSKDAPQFAVAASANRDGSSSVIRAFVSALGLQFALCCPAQQLLLSGATVHTISGETLSPGSVLIENGKVKTVAANVPGSGAQTIDLKGLHLYPGLIAMNTVLGLTEISGVRATQDSAEVGEYTPDVEAWIAVNPDSELIPVSRANGIAYFEAVPQGAVVSGQSGL